MFKSVNIPHNLSHLPLVSLYADNTMRPIAFFCDNYQQPPIIIGSGTPQSPIPVYGTVPLSGGWI